VKQNESLLWKSPDSFLKKHDRCIQKWKKSVSFFNYCAIVHLEFISAGQMLNLAYYLKVLRHVRNAVRRKQPEKWTAGMLLQHNNASGHAALLKRVLDKAFSSYYSTTSLLTCPIPSTFFSVPPK
jgi:hypothetical protein